MKFPCGCGRLDCEAYMQIDGNVIHTTSHTSKEAIETVFVVDPITMGKIIKELRRTLQGYGLDVHR